MNKPFGGILPFRVGDRISASQLNTLLSPVRAMMGTPTQDATAGTILTAHGPQRPSRRPKQYLPTCTMLLWPVDALPDGFLWARGQAVSRTVYAKLHWYAATALYASPWGVGDGATTFNVPNAQDVVIMASGGTYSLGDTGGSATHDHDDHPDHVHPQQTAYIDDVAAGSDYNLNDPNGLNTFGVYDAGGSPASMTLTHSTESNLDPYLTLHWIIKY